MNKLGSNRRLVTDLHGGYSRCKTKAIVMSKAVGPGFVTALIREMTTLYFAYRDAGAPASTAYVADHNFTFVLKNGSWQISKGQYFWRSPGVIGLVQERQIQGGEIDDGYVEAAMVTRSLDEPLGDGQTGPARPGRVDPMTVRFGMVLSLARIFRRSLVDHGFGAGGAGCF